MKKITINSQRNNILNDTFEIQSHVGYFVDFISLTKDDLSKKVKCFQNLELFFDELYAAKQAFRNSDLSFNLDYNKNCLIKLEANNNQDKILNIDNMYFIFNKDTYRFVNIKTQQYSQHHNFENNVNQMNGFVYDKQQKEFIYCVAEKNKLQFVKDKSSIEFYMDENRRNCMFMDHKNLMGYSFSNEIQKDKNYLYRAFKMIERNNAFVVDLVKCHLSSITYNHNEKILGVTFSEKFTQQLKRNTDKNNTIFDRMKQLEKHFDIDLYNNVLEEIKAIAELKQLTQDKQVKQVSLIKPLDDILSSCLTTTLKEESKLDLIPDTFNQFYESVKESIFKPVKKTAFKHFYLETQPDLNFDFFDSKTINQMYTYLEKKAVEYTAEKNDKTKEKNSMIVIKKKLKEHDILLLNNDIYRKNFFYFHSPESHQELYQLVKSNFKYKHDKTSLFINYIQNSDLDELPTGFAKNYTFFINGKDSIMAATVFNNDNRQNRHLSLSVYNKDFEYLYNIAYEDNKPFINSSKFFYYEATNRAAFKEQNFDLIYLKEKNTIRIEKPSINLTSIQFKDSNNIICKFKKSDFSTLVLDQNLHIKEIQLSSTFKKELNLSGKVVLSDISAQSLHDIHSVINERLQHEVELYNLLNDKKIAFKNRVSFFERDLLYLKEVLQNKESIINNFEESTGLYKKILNYFNEYNGLKPQSKAPLFDDLEYFSIHKDALKIESDKLCQLYDVLANHSNDSLKFSQLNKKLTIKKQP